MGNLKDMYNKLHGIKINNDCTKVIGIYLDHNTEKCIEKLGEIKSKKLERLENHGKNENKHAS